MVVLLPAVAVIIGKQYPAVKANDGNALVIMVKATGRAEDHEALADALMADVEVKDFEYT